MFRDETIVAVSSAAGGGGWRGIVRLSGGRAWELARGVVEELGGEAGGNRVYEVRLKGVGAGLPGRLVLFEGPRSFTGWDVAELHVPGSAGLMRMLLEVLIGRGARQAGAGEFTAQGFFNGKMDLTQAEGVAATIGAANERQLRAASRLREGDSFKWMRELAERIAGVLAKVEAGIDFAEEEGVSFISGRELREEMAGMGEYLEGAVRRAVRLERMGTLPTVVFVGKPNVGKSSLMNVLSGGERAIVSAVAGTTRDMLTAVMRTGSGEVRLVDVAGEEELGEGGEGSEMRGKMMEARERAIREADVIVDVRAKEDDEEGSEARGRGFESVVGNGFAEVIGVWNKEDLLGAEVRRESWGQESGVRWGDVSAKTGFEVERLRGEIERVARRVDPGSAEVLVLNQRHRAALEMVRGRLMAAGELAGGAGSVERHVELIAADLRGALDLLGEITGVVSPDEILGRIFATFCIGK